MKPLQALRRLGLAAVLCLGLAACALQGPPVVRTWPTDQVTIRIENNYTNNETLRVRWYRYGSRRTLSVVGQDGRYRTIRLPKMRSYSGTYLSIEILSTQTVLWWSPDLAIFRNGDCYRLRVMNDPSTSGLYRCGNDPRYDGRSR